MHGHADIGGVAARDLRKGLAVGRVEYLDAQAGVRGHQAVGDEVLGVHRRVQGGIGSVRFSHGRPGATGYNAGREKFSRIRFFNPLISRIPEHFP